MAGHTKKNPGTSCFDPTQRGIKVGIALLYAEWRECSNDSIVQRLLRFDVFQGILAKE